ncbi:DUF3488 domain-containing transglutaminase family protein [Diaphorobacter sp. NR2-3-3-1]|nr:DUF3488 domain-containing transglutaminase family protein [Diaphorobacter caeni]
MLNVPPHSSSGSRTGSSASSGLIQRLTSLPRETRDTLWLLLVVGWVISPLTPHVPPWTMPFAYALLLWRAWLAWTQRPLPNRWVKGGLLLIAVVLTVVSHKTIVGRDAGVTLIIMLLVLKTLELRARRDAMVIFFLGFFTLLANFFFSQSLVVAVVMLLGLLGLLTALINSNMPVGKPPLAKSMRTAAWMSLLGAPIMLVLFMLFPRMAPLWGMPGEDLRGRSGLSDEMKIGSMASLVLDESVAMRIKFDTPGGRPPEQRHLYFRGPVMSYFNGQEWFAGSTYEARANNGAGTSSAELTVRGEPIKYEVTMEANRRNWLLLLDAADKPPVLPAELRARMSPSLQWIANRPIVNVLRYTAESHIDFSSGPTERTRELKPYVQLPHGFNPRTQELAEQMRADPALQGKGNMAYVNAALQRLRSGGYTYTLEPGLTGTHSADEFWFDTKLGFCEHIASAFVVLMRGLDIPARIVSGYQGGEINGYDGYWTVRQADAHAWTEVWVEGRGWIRIDPTGAVMPSRIGEYRRLQTPQGALGEAMSTVISPTMLMQMRAAWEAVNNRWNQWVLNYTQERQLNLLRSLGFETPSWQDLARLLGLIAGLSALIGVGWSLWEKNHQDPWQRMLQTVRQKLVKLGIDLPVHLPPRSMAQRIRAERPDGSLEPVAQWLLRVDQARYAPKPEVALSPLQRGLRDLQWPGTSNSSSTPAHATRP